MQRKRSIFLLEIIIAMVLVGLFSVYFLRSSLKTLYEERRALLDLEFERLCDLHRMELIQRAWNRVETLTLQSAKEELFSRSIRLGNKSFTKTKRFKIWCARQHEKGYDLVLQEDGKEKYHYFVKKETK